MIYNYKYELPDGTITTIKPTNPEQSYITWVNLAAPDGYAYKHKYNSLILQNIWCTLDMTGFWELILLDELN